MTSVNRIVSAQVQSHAVMASWSSPGPLTAPLDGPGRGTQPSATALRDTSLRQDLIRLARQPRLLVACDYDGTLAPIVPDPWSVRPLPESVAALRLLAAMPDTTATGVSRRALRELAAMSRLPYEVHLIGRHGSGFDTGVVHPLHATT